MYMIHDVPKKRRHIPRSRWKSSPQAILEVQAVGYKDPYQPCGHSTLALFCVSPVFSFEQVLVEVLTYHSLLSIPSEHLLILLSAYPPSLSRNASDPEAKGSHRGDGPLGLWIGSDYLRTHFSDRRFCDSEELCDNQFSYRNVRIETENTPSRCGGLDSQPLFFCSWKLVGVLRR